MSEESKIQWTNMTFNMWRGCTKVSEGCRNCYAETMSGRNPRVLGEWGPNGRRSIAAESYWRGPSAWNRDAEKAGERRWVFCASLADVFEGPETMPKRDVPAVEKARARLFDLIVRTSSLNWILLTKRPQNVRKMVPGGWLTGGWPSNALIGTSVEDQKSAESRLPILCDIPARVRCVSVEPLLEAIDIREWLPKLHWIKVGGESGSDARPFDPFWARLLLDQCKEAGVAFFLKQLGSNVPGMLTLRHKGGELDDIPADIRVREFPTVA